MSIVVSIGVCHFIFRNWRTEILELRVSCSCATKELPPPCNFRKQRPARRAKDSPRFEKRFPCLAQPWVSPEPFCLIYSFRGVAQVAKGWTTGPKAAGAPDVGIKSPGLYRLFARYAEDLSQIHPTRPTTCAANASSQPTTLTRQGRQWLMKVSSEPVSTSSSSKHNWNGRPPSPNCWKSPIQGGDLPAPDLILPVPLHPKRLQERGFNQSGLLAGELARKLQVPVSFNTIVRKKQAQPQTRLNRRQRLKNVKGAFELTGADRVRGRRILLLDDVFTTGTTLSECARTLKKRGGASEVHALTVTRALPR